VALQLFDTTDWRSISKGMTTRQKLHPAGEEDSRIALKIALRDAPSILYVLEGEEEIVRKKSISLKALRGICKLLGSLEVAGHTAHLIRLAEIME